VEDEMAFLDTSIRLIPCGKYITLDFDWIADDPKVRKGVTHNPLPLSPTAQLFPPSD